MSTGRADVKSNLRRRLRAQREERYIEHNLLHLLELPEFSEATVIASYFSYGYEPSTIELNQSIINLGKTLLLPRIEGDQIHWIQWDGRSENLKANGNFQEPLGSTFENLGAIDLVLVPALAIDPDGYRLGQGGGYYDRALPKLSAWKHGVVFSFEKMEHDLPRDSWDVPVNSW